ncbi:MAG TPA: tetratricopeptide repeat protein [Atribacteraceae bacterium]|nr:tetratricopeptide repeat protein [Atribacteraceae bacterium]
MGWMRQHGGLVIGLVGILMVLFITGSPVWGIDAWTHHRNGYIFFSQGDFERSAEQYRLALEIDPGFHAARYWLGKALEQQGRIPEALAE